MAILNKALNTFASKKRYVLAIFIINSLSLQILFALERRFVNITGQAVFDTQNNLTQEAILAQLPLYSGEGFDAYLLFWIYDFIFPFIGSVFFATLMTWLLTKIHHLLAKRLLQGRLPLIAFIATLADWLENLSLMLTILQTPPSNSIWINSVLLFKQLKLALLTVNGIIIVSLIIWLIGDFVRRQMSKNP